MLVRFFAGPSLQKTMLACFLLVPLAAASDHYNYEESHSDVRDFAAGGTLHIRLGVGDLRLACGDASRIQLHYTVKSRRESRLKDAHVDFEARGDQANLEFHAPSGGSTQFDVELEVPRNTTLDVHEKVGDMTVEEIEGDTERVSTSYGRTCR